MGVNLGTCVDAGVAFGQQSAGRRVFGGDVKQLSVFWAFRAFWTFWGCGLVDKWRGAETFRFSVLWN